MKAKKAVIEVIDDVTLRLVALVVGHIAIIMLYLSMWYTILKSPIKPEINE